MFNFKNLITLFFVLIFFRQNANSQNNKPSVISEEFCNKIYESLKENSSANTYQILSLMGNIYAEFSAIPEDIKLDVADFFCKKMKIFIKKIDNKKLEAHLSEHKFISLIVSEYQKIMKETSAEIQKIDPELYRQIKSNGLLEYPNSEKYILKVFEFTKNTILPIKLYSKEIKTKILIQFLRTLCNQTEISIK